ncbi:HAMP domain-containing histidine kinase [Marivirga sp. S37H4]|uniref:histidine kinase n=1 Tax=Marivirga aurantiaca TaxID=2802615 RepID=A0A934WWB1_9BACT|nr:HAMP domain-containing sensor histidine kinase [Marivirga aurantiaca]MBK6264169.1 HAMP domain-containing histidine kinase [Marivirga aurantiaca]
MTKDRLYKLNPILLSFYDKEIENEFNKNFFKQDLYSLRFVIALGIVLSIIFIFVDMLRYEENKVTSLAFRGGMALILMIFGAFTFLLKEKHYRLTQFLGMLVAAFVGVVFFAHYHSIEDPGFDIFLSNILMVLIFIFSTIMGFRFRYSLLINTFFYIAYIVYIDNFNYSIIAARQISQLSVIYSVGILAAYLLEKQKINLFINKKELHKEIRKVDNLNKIKNKLFSIISHDLRGPIVSLKGIVSLFNLNAISHDEIKVLAKDLERDLDKTSNLMENMLAWSKSQLDGIEIKKVEINIWKEIKGLSKLFKTQFSTKAITFVMEPEADITIYSDKEMVQIIFRNLISNAIKFTPHGGEIRVSGEVAGNNYKIKIKDSGVGIEPKKLLHLFEIDKNNVVGTSSSSGSGIGLMLVKEFVDANNGIVSCESVIGGGTIFSVSLPIADTSLPI